MVFSRKKQWIIFLAVKGILLFAVLMFPLYVKLVKALPTFECGMLMLFNLYCPSCGGTRAVASLLEFDILASLKYNPIVVVSALILVIYEVAMIFHLIKGGDREFFIKPWMVFAFTGFWFTYFVLRNVLLLLGIDLLI